MLNVLLIRRSDWECIVKMFNDTINQVRIGIFSWDSFHNLKICPLLAVRKAAGQRHMYIGFPFQTWKLRVAFMQSVAPYLISPARMPSFASTSVHSSLRSWTLCVWWIFLFSAKTMGVLGGDQQQIETAWLNHQIAHLTPPTGIREQLSIFSKSGFHHSYTVRAAGVQL